MVENIDVTLVDWSRWQFALTAIYHWFFVPLTLGITFIIAIMESIYVKTGKEEWKKMTKFWMTLFGINFAIGVATGIILEFEFGTNWSNYSWAHSYWGGSVTMMGAALLFGGLRRFVRNEREQVLPLLIAGQQLGYEVRVEIETERGLAPVSVT